MRCFVKLLSVLAVPLGMVGLFVRPLTAEMLEYTTGHADIGLALEAPGQLFLHYHFGVGSAVLNGALATSAQAELAPAEAYVRVRDAAIVSLSAPVDFLGNAAGDLVWIIPSGNTGGLPYLGIASEELDPMEFSSAGFRLTSMSGPLGGSFALWQNPAVGPANVLMRSNDGIDPLIDFVPSVVGGHDHFNYGFTKAGIYDLGIEGYATGLAGTLTDSGTFRFVVGDATAVPEPNALLLLLASGLGAMTFSRSATGRDGRKYLRA